MPKKKVLKTNEDINQTYEIIAGFNIPDGDGEKRFGKGSERSPKFVQPKDFEPDVWEALVKGGAVKLIEDDTQPSEDDAVIFEKNG